MGTHSCTSTARANLLKARAIVDSLKKNTEKGPFLFKELPVGN